MNKGIESTFRLQRDGARYMATCSWPALGLQLGGYGETPAQALSWLADAIKDASSEDHALLRALEENLDA